MSSELKQNDYLKQEFISVVLTVHSKSELSLRKTFDICYFKAKDIRMKHGFSPDVDSAWKQFKRYIKQLNIEPKKNL